MEHSIPSRLPSRKHTGSPSVTRVASTFQRGFVALRADRLGATDTKALGRGGTVSGDVLSAGHLRSQSGVAGCVPLTWIGGWGDRAGFRSTGRLGLLNPCAP